jgi:hypothetical protein
MERWRARDLQEDIEGTNIRMSHFLQFAQVQRCHVKQLIFLHILAALSALILGCSPATVVGSSSLRWLRLLRFVYWQRILAE